MNPVTGAKQACLHKTASRLRDPPGAWSDSLRGSFCRRRLNLRWKVNGESGQISKALSWLKHRQRGLDPQTEKDAVFGRQGPELLHGRHVRISQCLAEGEMVRLNKASHNFALVGLVHKVELYERETMLRRLWFITGSGSLPKVSSTLCDSNVTKVM